MLEIIAPAQVAKVRAATQDRVNFYTTEEILREHPLKPTAPAKGTK